MKRISILFIICCIAISSYAQLDELKVTLTDGIDNAQLKTKIETNVSALLNAFNVGVMKGKKPKIAPTTCTESATKDILSIWKSSEISCPATRINQKCLTLPTGGYQIRNIPVLMLNAPESQQAQEIVINLTAQGIIDNLTIAMEKQRYEDIIAVGKRVDDLKQRQIIIDFVENFRTAYNRKDLPYLQNVFSDNALIITGKVIKIKSNNSDVTNRLSREKIVYIKHNKTQYMENMKRCFKRNKYIDIDFDDIEIVRHRTNKKLYGVTLKQDWKSSTYSDTGYVFLMIDFSDELQPYVQVRTWQPEKYNGKSLNKKEMFSIDSFNIKGDTTTRDK